MATPSHIHCAVLILHINTSSLTLLLNLTSFRSLTCRSLNPQLIYIRHSMHGDPTTLYSPYPTTRQHTQLPCLCVCIAVCVCCVHISLNCDALISLSLAWAHTLPLFHSASFLFSFLSLELVCSALLLRRQLTQHQSWVILFLFKKLRDFSCTLNLHQVCCKLIALYNSISSQYQKHRLFMFQFHQWPFVNNLPVHHKILILALCS